MARVKSNVYLGAVCLGCVFGTRVRYPFGGQYYIMSKEEKQATPKAAFVFLVPLENEQPAQQAVKRVSAGS